MADTQLNYRAAPPAAFAGSATELSVIISNEGTNNIDFGTDDCIQLMFSKAMVKNFNFTGKGPAGSGFSVTASQTKPGVFTLQVPFTAVTIKAGEQLVFTFGQVPISDTAASTSIGVEEVIGSKTEKKVIDFEVRAKGLGVIAWLDKMVVAESEPTYLNWASSGASNVEVTGFPTGQGTRSQDLEGKVLVYVPDRDNTGQWGYTVTAYSGNHSANSKVILQCNPPIIHAFEVKVGGEPLKRGQAIEVTDEVVFSWNTQYASSVILSTPVVANERYPIPANPVNKSPGNDLLTAYMFNWGQLPASARYTLTANGFDKAASSEISIPIKPPELVFFKYEGADSGSEVFNVSPKGWRGAKFHSISKELATYTINKPGGKPAIYYLGAGDTVHPQIYRFYAKANGGTFTISWNTRNCKALSLQPGNIQLSGAEIAKGSKAGLAAGTYVLTATGNNGETVVSSLVVAKN